MKKYNIKVNGKSYEVEVDEIGGTNSTPVSAPVITKVDAPVSKPKVVDTPVVSAPVSGAINAPMPGTVLDIKVKEGQSVKAGDILIILEAMKMENEIVAPSDGVVNKIHTDKGATVSTGDPIISLG